MAEDGPSITLTDAQVAQVVGAAARHGLSSVLGGDPEALSVAALGTVDARLSRSLLYGLVVFACFPVDGTKRTITAVARQLGLSPATVYRYAATLTAVGLLERDPDSREYRRCFVPSST